MKKADLLLLIYNDVDSLLTKCKEPLNALKCLTDFIKYDYERFEENTDSMDLTAMHFILNESSKLEENINDFRYKLRKFRDEIILNHIKEDE